MVELHLFNGRTGYHEGTLTLSAAASWTDNINENGSINASVLRAFGSGDVLDVLHPWRVIAAIIDMGTTDSRGFPVVLHAGYVTRVSAEPGFTTASMVVGGGGSILEKRFVLNPDWWNNRWIEGKVTFNDGNATNNDLDVYQDKSAGGIMTALIRNTKVIGALPIEADIAPFNVKGGVYLDYKGYDFRTIASAVTDLGNAEYGPEYRFRPELYARSGSAHPDALRFVFECSADWDELIDHKWRMVTTTPGSGVSPGAYDAVGDAMCTTYVVVGGKDSDSLLTYRSSSNTLINKGWPVLMAVDTTHTDTSNTDHLKSYANAGVNAGDDEQRTRRLTVDRRLFDVHVGDWIDLRESDSQAATDTRLKVVGVSGTTDTTMLEVECRYRR